MERIERVLAIDWSGQKVGVRKKIWLCEVVGGRVLRLEPGRSRGEIAEHLIEEKRRDPRFVVGLDFAFSFPAPFLRKRGHAEIETVWEEAEREGEDWLAKCKSPPFWGKPGTKKPPLGDLLLRRTEATVRRQTGHQPLSVFQIGGVGAVGVGSIRGMPVLRKLRAAGFAVWPFHAPSLPLVIEIWPRVLMGSVQKTNPVARREFLAKKYPGLDAESRTAGEQSDDSFDALVSALEMGRRRAELGTLNQASDPVTLLEGEIWLPRREGDPSAVEAGRTAGRSHRRGA